MNGRFLYGATAGVGPNCDRRHSGCSRPEADLRAGRPRGGMQSAQMLKGSSEYAVGKYRSPGLASARAPRDEASQSWSSSFGAPNTPIQPFKQEGNTLLAANGTNTWLLWGLAATECAVPAGNTNGLPPTLSVGTTWTRVSL